MHQESNENLKKVNIFYFVIYWTQKLNNDFIFLCSLHCLSHNVPALRKRMNTSRKKNSLAESATTLAPGRGESVTELMPFMNFLVHSYTFCSDRHASPYWTFLHRRISMGFIPLLLKKRMTDAVLLWCMLQGGPPSLHYYCAVVLNSCIVLPPVGHSSNHEYHCCQLTRQSTSVSIFYRTLKIFIWLSFVKKFYTLLFTYVFVFTAETQHETHYGFIRTSLMQIV